MRVTCLLLALAALPPPRSRKAFTGKAFQSAHLGPARVPAGRRPHRAGRRELERLASADTTTDKRGGVGATALSHAERRPSRQRRPERKLRRQGQIQRSGRLLATADRHVTAIAPNGDLVVSGSQLIEVNEEKQHIQLEGRVRPTT